jgi:hypothetical protein
LPHPELPVRQSDKPHNVSAAALIPLRHWILSCRANHSSALSLSSALQGRLEGMNQQLAAYAEDDPIVLYLEDGYSGLSPCLSNLHRMPASLRQ